MRVRGLCRRTHRAALLAAAAAVALPCAAHASDLDTIGLTQLLALDPTLTGAGVAVAQAEADSGGANTNTFEVNPAAVGQPASLFSYIDDNGNVLSGFTSADESDHADNVGTIFYGTTGTGVAPGVSSVASISADYFAGTSVPNLLPINATVINQSFIEIENQTTPLTVADQETSDTQYDNYVDQFGSIIVSAAGNAGDFPNVNAPSTAYNVISVAADPGPSSVGPTIDNGRSKPDITAPGDFTSYSTPLVSGSAAILVQAGSRGDGGAAVETQATDWRTIEALLLNGASKTAVTFNRTPTTPLDPTNGAGLLNVYQSYLQLTAGMHPFVALSGDMAGGAHVPDTTGSPITSLSGWDFETITSGLTSDEYANYIFQPPANVTSYTATATLVWARQFNPNPNTVMGINNLDLYLYDTTTNTLIDSSVSQVDNLQDLYDLNLTPGNRYDLEVLKQAGGVSSSETYALAFNFAGVESIWSAAGGGSWANANNWTGGIPQTPGAAALFGSSIQENSTVTLDGNWTLGNINFNSTNSYTLIPGSSGALMLNNNSHVANITDTAGSHTITAAIISTGGLSIQTSTASQILTLSGGLASSGPISVAGPGTVVMSGPANTAAGLTIAAGSTIDLGKSSLVINFAGSPDPAATIAGYLASGYNNGAWTGTGLTSSAAAASPGKFALGYADGNVDANTPAAANQIVVKYTLAGDANLDGSVGFADLAAVAENFGFTGRDWAEGNFIYDPNGSVGFSDLVLVAENFGLNVSTQEVSAGGISPNWSGSRQIEPTAVVPEPVGLAFAAAALSLTGRRYNRRRRCCTES